MALKQRPWQLQKKCTTNLAQLKTLMIQFSALFLAFSIPFSLFPFFSFFFLSCFSYLFGRVALLFHFFPFTVQHFFFFFLMIDSMGYVVSKLLYLPDFSISLHGGVQAVAQSSQGPLLLAGTAGQQLEV